MAGIQDSHWSDLVHSLRGLNSSIYCMNLEHTAAQQLVQQQKYTSKQLTRRL